MSGDDILIKIVSYIIAWLIRLHIVFVVGYFNKWSFLYVQNHVVCLLRVTWEQVRAPPEALPVEETQSVNIHLLQRRLTVPEVQSSTQDLRGHVPHRPHLQTQTDTPVALILNLSHHHHPPAAVTRPDLRYGHGVVVSRATGPASRQPHGQTEVGEDTGQIGSDQHVPAGHVSVGHGRFVLV